MIGALSDIGLSSAARRFIPEYTELKVARPLARISVGQPLARLRHRHRHRRGRRHRRDAARALSRSASSSCRFISPASPFRFTDWCRRKPASRSRYDWPNLALMPFYHLAPARHHGADGRGLSARRADRRGDRDDRRRRHHLGGDHRAAGRAQSAASRHRVPAGPKRYESKIWLATSIPIFVVEGFYLLLTYVDILALEHFRSPDDVAVYYAGARLLAIVAFVYFAIAGATTHKFTAYHVSRRPQDGWRRFSPRPSTGRSGRRSRSARVILALRPAAAGSVRRRFRAAAMS